MRLAGKPARLMRGGGSGAGAEMAHIFELLSDHGDSRPEIVAEGL